MPRITSGLAFIYSGGAGNSSASGSLGGPASTTLQRYVASQSYTASTIPGVVITHAARNSVGTGTLTYATNGKMLTWLSSVGFSSAVGLEGSGWYTLGVSGSGYLRVYITYGSLPTYDIAQQISIATKEDTVFGAPTAQELPTGSTEYRCLYIVNETSGALQSATLQLTDHAVESSVHVGSIFDPVSKYFAFPATINSMAFHNLRTLTPPAVRGTNPKTYREGLSQLTGAGLPYFPVFPSRVVNSSNGVDEYVPPLLADKYDSTGLLANMTWGTTLSWPDIPAGRMVSMYFRRIMPANPTVPTFEYMDIDMLVTLT